jgi:hypothetical protein
VPQNEYSEKRINNTSNTAKMTFLRKDDLQVIMTFTVLHSYFIIRETTLIMMKLRYSIGDIKVILTKFSSFKLFSSAKGRVLTHAASSRITKTLSGQCYETFYGRNL